MFSCLTRGFCPSCRSKRLEEWGEWMREELFLDVPHRQVVFTTPKMRRIFFKYNRRLLGALCRSNLHSLSHYFEVVTETSIQQGLIASESLSPLFDPPGTISNWIFIPSAAIYTFLGRSGGRNHPRKTHSASAAKKEIIILMKIIYMPKS